MLSAVKGAVTWVIPWNPRASVSEWRMENRRQTADSFVTALNRAPSPCRDVRWNKASHHLFQGRRPWRADNRWLHALPDHAETQECGQGTFPRLLRSGRWPRTPCPPGAASVYPTLGHRFHEPTWCSSCAGPCDWCGRRKVTGLHLGPQGVRMGAGGRGGEGNRKRPRRDEETKTAS